MIKIVNTETAPEAIGPYSQAVISNGTVYCSGQIALKPESMEMAGADIGTETIQVMENLKALLKAAGSDLSNVLKCTIFLAEMSDFARVNEVYGSYFDAHQPARETVAVKGLPKGARVEISCIASVV